MTHIPSNESLGMEEQQMKKKQKRNKLKKNELFKESNRIRHIEGQLFKTLEERESKSKKLTDKFGLIPDEFSHSIIRTKTQKAPTEKNLFRDFFRKLKGYKRGFLKLKE